MMDVRPLVIMMHYMCIMMLHNGTRGSIMCVADTHVLYVMEECSRRCRMAEYDWLLPVMGLWADGLGLLGF